jgi:hypothetical protein
MTQQALMAKALKLKKQIQDPNFVGDKDWIKFLFCEVVDRLEQEKGLEELMFLLEQEEPVSKAQKAPTII